MLQSYKRFYCLSLVILLLLKAILFYSAMDEFSLELQETVESFTAQWDDFNTAVTQKPVPFKPSADMTTLIDDCKCQVAERTGLEQADVNAQRFLNVQSILDRSSNCSSYFEVIKRLPDVPSEDLVPLAFSHLIHQQPSIFEALMATFYHPLNAHCIYLDNKTKPEIRQAILSIVNCYQTRYSKAKENIFVLNFTQPIQWGTFSIVQAEVECLELLLNQYLNWKYYINLAGSELPIKTLKEVSEVLTKYPSSIFHGVPLERSFFRNRLSDLNNR